MADDFGGLIPSPDAIRNTLVPIMKKRGIAADDPVLREEIISTAINEARGGAETLAWACNRKGMDRRSADRLIKDGIVMDLMSVINRAETGTIV